MATKTPRPKLPVQQLAILGKHNRLPLLVPSASLYSFYASQAAGCYAKENKTFGSC